MDLQEKIIKFCNMLGLELVGFIKCREFKELIDIFQKRKESNEENEFEEKDIEKRIKPNLLMNEGKTIISIAFPYYTKSSSSKNGFSVYTKGLDYHKVVLKYLENICEFIRENGGKAIPLVDSNPLPERYIAYLAGIGFIGKNNMLITKKYGSYVFLGEIITDLDISNDDKNTIEGLNKYVECGECEICFSECPSKAINKSKRNSNICVSYLTQKKDLTDKEINLLNGRIFGCDNCQIKCKYNLDIEYTNIDEFKPLEFMNNEELDGIINMNNSKFKETFKQTSCGWRGKNTLIRNAIIKKSKYNQESLEEVKSESPYIKSYIDRLL